MEIFPFLRLTLPKLLAIGAVAGAAGAAAFVVTAEDQPTYRSTATIALETVWPNLTDFDIDRREGTLTEAIRGSELPAGATRVEVTSSSFVAPFTVAVEGLDANATVAAAVTVAQEAVLGQVEPARDDLRAFVTAGEEALAEAQTEREAIAAEVGTSDVNGTADALIGTIASYQQSLAASGSPQQRAEVQALLDAALVEQDRIAPLREAYNDAAIVVSVREQELEQRRSALSVADAQVAAASAPASYSTNGPSVVSEVDSRLRNAVAAALGVVLLAFGALTALGALRRPQQPAVAQRPVLVTDDDVIDLTSRRPLPEPQSEARQG
jgi:hypothetical protein